MMLINTSSPTTILPSFPPFLQSVIASVINSTQAPAPLIFSALLGTISEAGQGAFDVETHVDRVTPTGLWVIPIGESGIGKSPVENLLRRAIRDLESLQAEKASKKLQQYESQIRVWKTIRNALTKELSKQTLLGGATDEIEKRLEVLSCI